MEWYWACLLLFGSVTGLMLIGLPVAIAFLGVNVVAALVFMGGTKGFVDGGFVFHHGACATFL
jgi:hypothetical protein